MVDGFPSPPRYLGGYRRIRLRILVSGLFKSKFPGKVRRQVGTHPARVESAQSIVQHLWVQLGALGCLLQLELINRKAPSRSEEHTSELQSHSDLVCRLLLEKKKQHLKKNYIE